ncbi:hypothetical protein B0H14DRAFT_2586252 [Mycena olivaceomarginata]|nr:hypothetical protein B0H14DRAFT_2586252 [Mycena olivaceomarginata]
MVVDKTLDADYALRDQPHLDSGCLTSSTRYSHYIVWIAYKHGTLAVLPENMTTHQQHLLLLPHTQAGATTSTKKMSTEGSKKQKRQTSDDDGDEALPPQKSKWRPLQMQRPLPVLWRSSLDAVGGCKEAEHGLSVVAVVMGVAVVFMVPVARHEYITCRGIHDLWEKWPAEMVVHVVLEGGKFCQVPMASLAAVAVSWYFLGSQTLLIKLYGSCGNGGIIPGHKFY